MPKNANENKKEFVKIDKQFDNLGQILKKSFEQIDKRFEDMDVRLGNMNARLFVIERDIAEIRAHFVYRPEFEDLMGRVKYLETKLGIKSGK
ncbi:MAG: hypothetical protein HZC14_00015 [Candidatus Niyogibacteria bacterium]|nr:hypothetical protein [Candidatus Niyogibacteria bacterium]